MVRVEFTEKELDNLIKVVRSRWAELSNSLENKKVPKYNIPVVKRQLKDAWNAYKSIKDLMGGV